MELITQETIVVLINISFFTFVLYQQRTYFERCLMMIKSNDVVDYSDYLNLDKTSTSILKDDTKEAKKELTRSNFFDLIDRNRNQ